MPKATLEVRGKIIHIICRTCFTKERAIRALKKQQNHNGTFVFYCAVFPTVLYTVHRRRFILSLAILQLYSNARDELSRADELLNSFPPTAHLTFQLNVTIIHHQK